MTDKKIAIEVEGLTRDAILQVNDIETEKVPTPEWGKDSFVWIKCLTGSERDWFEGRFSELTGSGKFVDFRAKYCSLIICDKNGENLFSEQDIQSLGKKNAKTLDRIFDQGMVLSGINKDGLDNADDFFDKTQPKENGSD
jgi:hypothetical protein